jgi:hypothetical protein
MKPYNDYSLVLLKNGSTTIGQTTISRNVELVVMLETKLPNRTLLVLPRNNLEMSGK